MSFKNLSTAKRTGIVCAIEVYEVYNREEASQPSFFDEIAEESDYTLFLTKEGIVRLATDKGNRKITDEKSIDICGFCGVELLNIYREDNYDNRIFRHFADGIEYDVQICTDIEVYCEEVGCYDEWEKVTVESYEFDKAVDLAVKNGGFTNMEDWVNHIVQLHQ